VKSFNLGVSFKITTAIKKKRKRRKPHEKSPFLSFFLFFSCRYSPD